jgi:hypothetical protein
VRFSNSSAFCGVAKVAWLLRKEALGEVPLAASINARKPAAELERLFTAPETDVAV